MRLDANELFRVTHEKLLSYRTWRRSEYVSGYPRFLHAPLAAINFQTAAMIKWDWLTGPRPGGKEGLRS